MITDFFQTTSIDGWDAVIALVVLVVGWICAGFAKRATLSLTHKWSGISEDAANVAARIVKYAIILLAVGIVLTVLGAPLQPVLAAVIIVCAVVFLALRGIAANFGAGLVIQARRVIHINDEIEVLGFSGTVKELNGRSVQLHTEDGRSVRIPNSAILDNPVTNMSERQLHRSEIEVRVDTAASYATIRSLISTALEDSDHIRSVPAVQALLAIHSPSGMTFRVRFWHSPRHRAEARSAAVSALADAFAAASIPAVIDWRIPVQPLTPPPDF